MDAIHERVKGVWTQGQEGVSDLICSAAEAELSPVTKWKFRIYTDTTLWVWTLLPNHNVTTSSSLFQLFLGNVLFSSVTLTADLKNHSEVQRECWTWWSVVSKWLVLGLVSSQQNSSALYFGLFFFLFFAFVMADKIWRKSCEFFSRSSFFGRRLVESKSEWVKVSMLVLRSLTDFRLEVCDHVNTYSFNFRDFYSFCNPQ